MAKLRHIAIATQHEEETARFYIDVFGLTEVGKIDLPIVSGDFLTDGTINFWVGTSGSARHSGRKEGGYHG